MFGFTRRSAKPTATPASPAPAMFEPLESRQLLSATLTPALTGATVPLTLTYNRSTLPPAQIAGARIHGVVLVTLTNSTTLLDRGSNTLTVYASTDGVVDPTDRVLGTVTRSVALPAGRFIRTGIVIRPQAAPLNGEYRVLIQGTDASGDVTTTADAGPLSIAAPNVNLTAAVGAPRPTALVPGRVFIFRATLTNTGNVDAIGPATVQIGFSPDGQNITLPLTSYTRGIVVRANGRATPLVFVARVPVGTPAGTYFPAVTITQNNTSTIVTGFSGTPITVGTNSLAR